MRVAILISLFACACFGQIDGGASDPPMDDPNDPPPTEVRITVHDPSGPLAGLPVVFLDVNDAVAADVVTDAQGTAIAKLATGSVTVIRAAAMSQPGPSASSLYTYVGVKAGDQLELALPSIEPSNPVTVNVTVPATEEVGVPVEVRTPCGSGQGIPPTIAVTLDGCGSETDFYVTELGLEQPASFLKRMQITDPVDLSGEIYREQLTSTYSVTNLPVGSSVSIEKRIETDLFRPVFTTGQIAVTPDQPIDVTLPNLPGTEEQTYATVTSMVGTAQIVGSRDPYGSGPAVIDLAGAMIITPSAPTIAGDTVSWTEQGSGAPDTVLATIRNTGVERYVAGPYAGASIKVPHLPAAHDAFNVKADDKATIALARVSGGFDAVRARVFGGPLAPVGGKATIAVDASPGELRP
jgi:hypothetical protein